MYCDDEESVYCDDEDSRLEVLFVCVEECRVGSGVCVLIRWNRNDDEVRQSGSQTGSYSHGVSRVEDGRTIVSSVT